jgi:hypothetical protein
MVAQERDVIEQRDTDVEIGELGERARRVVQRGVDRCTRKRTREGEDDSFGAASLREIVVGDGHAGHGQPHLGPPAVRRRRSLRRILK